ncbi:adhesion protein [Salmonella enterica]|nr:fimbrial protein [Salmonella enterica subsp. enterica serovar Thompson]EDV3051792.1 fimbrial protein [Salmonella enterica subsp. enterica]EDW0273776.1 fimbrial protein [Salmonella enterica subsp. enterica serovar Thompson]EDW1373600.1 fimbrial protein [Salmonella enterica subsp. enterica]EHI5877611.1 fimbrial protein [Salmonella enterica]
MTERLFNMKSLILSGMFLFFTVCDAARANIEWSYCNANGSVNIQNINIKAGQYSAGDELQRISIPFSYTCVTKPKTYATPYNATISVKNVKQMVDALKKSGLGMELFIQEGSRTPVHYTWAEIQKGFTGWAASKVFGQQLEVDKTYNLNGALTLRIFVEQKFNNTFVNFSIPGSTFDILPYNPSAIFPPTVPYTPLTISAFNIRFIPDNSGRVIISPSATINMGRFYTEYQETMLAREMPFTVTAQQNIGTQTPFVAPLAIEFRTNGLTLADADSTVILKNNKQENNGFRLSVMDVDNNTPVKFNVKADMGSIHLDNGAGGRIIKQYKAKVEAIPGAVIKTGAFSAAMTVIVTYN